MSQILNLRKMKDKIQFRPDRLRQLALYLKSNAVRDIMYNIEDEPEYIDHGDFVEEQLSFYYQAIVASVFVFNRDWVIDNTGHVVWKKDASRNTVNSALQFYGLTCEQFEHLFIPHHQIPMTYGGTVLGYSVHPREVGENIIQFLERMQILSN